VSLNNLANLLQAEGRTDEAIGFYRMFSSAVTN
jgi:hypothetical protein